MVFVPQNRGVSMSRVRACYSEPCFAVRDMLAEPGAREIFVFGSNLRGIHGAGAAKTARAHLGARPGKGLGFMGDCYAIPTKESPYQTLSLDLIAEHIESFTKVTHRRENIFYVTAVGTGYAGYHASEIAPLFNNVVCCYLPESWKPYIDRD